MEVYFNQDQNILGKIIDRQPDGKVIVNFDGTILTLSESDNQYQEAYKNGGEITGEITKTKAFKDWFGDSEAVDKNGNPLVVNHSTLDDDFNVFYGGRIFRTSNRETEVKPIWFSYGEAYATDPEIKNIKAYLKIDKLFDFSNKSHLKEYEKYVTENYPSYPTENIEYYNEDWVSLEEDDVPAYLYEMGYDGWKTTQENAIAVFNSKQIKLADGSNTTFDSKNPDIRFKTGGSVQTELLTPDQRKLIKTQAFKNWFGDWKNNPDKASKIVNENGEPAVCFHGTNSDFNEFRSDVGYSNDQGFYGKGFYFVYQPYKTYFKYAKQEAGYYGGRIIEAFLNIRNPFVFSDLQLYEGKKVSGVTAPVLVFLTNLSIKFPELSNLKPPMSKYTLGELTELWNEHEKNLKWNEVEKDESDYVVRNSHFPFKAKKKWFKAYTKEEIHEEKLPSGEVDQWVEKDYLEDYGQWYNEDQKRWIPSFSELKAYWIAEAMENHNNFSVDYHIQGYMTRIPEISEAIRNNGYDGIIAGDEVIAFEPNQIKLADGSNRTFDKNSNDMRFKNGGKLKDDQTSKKETSETQKTQFNIGDQSEFDKQWHKYEGDTKGGIFTIEILKQLKFPHGYELDQRDKTHFTPADDSMPTIYLEDVYSDKDNGNTIYYRPPADFWEGYKAPNIEEILKLIYNYVYFTKADGEWKKYLTLKESKELLAEKKNREIKNKAKSIVESKNSIPDRFKLAMINDDWIYYADEDEGDENANTMMFDHDGRLVSNNYFGNESFYQDLLDKNWNWADLSVQYGSQEMRKEHGLWDSSEKEITLDDLDIMRTGGKIPIRDKDNYKKYLKILGELKLDNTDDDWNRYEYGKNYEQHENKVVKVKKSDFSDLDDLDIMRTGGKITYKPYEFNETYFNEADNPKEVYLDGEFVGFRFNRGQDLEFGEYGFWGATLNNETPKEFLNRENETDFYMSGSSDQIEQKIREYYMKKGGSVQSPAQDKFIYVLREFHKGKLKHGTTGKKVTDLDMAKAIAYSEARKINPKFSLGGRVTNASPITEVSGGHYVAEIRRNGTKQWEEIRDFDTIGFSQIMIYDRARNNYPIYSGKLTLRALDLLLSRNMKYPYMDKDDLEYHQSKNKAK